MRRRCTLFLLVVLASCLGCESRPRRLEWDRKGRCTHSGGRAFDIDDHLGVRWYGAYCHDAKLAFVRRELIRASDDREPVYRSSYEMVDCGENRIADWQTYSIKGELLEMFESTEEEGQEDTWHGVVEGNTMTVISCVGGVEEVRKVPAPAVTLADVTAYARLISSQPEAGASVTTHDYSLEDDESTTSHLVIKGKRRMLLNGAYHTVYDAEKVNDEDDMRASVLFDESGTMLKCTFGREPDICELRLESEEEARKTGAWDFVLQPKGRLPLGISTRLRFMIAGLDERVVPLLQDARQRFEELGDGVWLLTLTRDTLPAHTIVLPVRDPELDKFLEPADLYQSNDPDIIATVAGLTYRPRVKGFAGHAWAEVYVGKWIAVDPTAGQPIASPDRIRLTCDGDCESSTMGRNLLRLSLEVVEDDAARE